MLLFFSPRVLFSQNLVLFSQIIVLLLDRLNVWVPLLPMLHSLSDTHQVVFELVLFSSKCLFLFLYPSCKLLVLQSQSFYLLFVYFNISLTNNLLLLNFENLMFFVRRAWHKIYFSFILFLQSKCWGLMFQFLGLESSFRLLFVLLKLLTQDFVLVNGLSG